MPIPAENMDGLFRFIAHGNPGAFNALHCFARIVRLADDIADGDSHDVQGDTAEILRIAFVELAGNEFYRSHATALSGPWLNGILGWQAGDEWKHSANRKTRMFGFVYRESIEHVAHCIAYFTGGYDHAREAMQMLHQISHVASPETFEDWEKERG